MLRADKETIVAELTEQLQESQSLVLTDYRGIRASELNELRHKLREGGVEFHVVKNSLLERALDASGLELNPELLETLVGPLAVARTTSEETTLPMRLLDEAASDHEQLQPLGGFLEGRFVGAEEVAALAKLPGRNEMMAMVVGAVQSPVTGVMLLVSTIIGNLMSGIDQIAAQKAAAEGEA